MGRYRKTFRIEAPLDQLWELMNDAERLRVDPATFPICRSSCRHRTRASYPIQAETTFLAVIRACLAAPMCQSCCCRRHDDEPRPSPHSINLCRARTGSLLVAARTNSRPRWSPKPRYGTLFFLVKASVE